MIGENGIPVTPDWSPEPHEAPDWIRAEVKPQKVDRQLCKQQSDGRGDE